MLLLPSLCLGKVLMINCAQGIHAGTNVSLDLDERPMPRGPLFPRYVACLCTLTVGSKLTLMLLQAKTQACATPRTRTDPCARAREQLIGMIGLPATRISFLFTSVSVLLLLV